MKESVEAPRAGGNDAVNVLPAGILIFKIFLPGTVPLSVTVPDVELKLRPDQNEYESATNLSRKSGTFGTTVVEATGGTEGIRAGPVNCAGCKAGNPRAGGCASAGPVIAAAFRGCVAPDCGATTWVFGADPVVAAASCGRVTPDCGAAVDGVDADADSCGCTTFSAIIYIPASGSFAQL